MSAPPSLTAQLRLRTTGLHRKAERAGYMARIITGTPTRRSYALLLRNLLPVYRQLEEGLSQHRDRLGALLRVELVRSAAIERDLVHLAGPGWVRDVPLLAAGADYAARVAFAAEQNAALLVAHAYTRYLGDLGGGPILKRRLSEALALQAEGLSFYDFPRITELSSFVAEYRAALDAAGLGLEVPGLVLDEAAAAFLYNIRLSEAVEAVAAADAPT